MQSDEKIMPLRSWPGPRSKILRYTLLRHIPKLANVHYDLMLELRQAQHSSERTLWGLQSAQLPEVGAKKIAWHTHGRHRHWYLNFEGEIDADRGLVERVDAGSYSVSKLRGIFFLTVWGSQLSGLYFLGRYEYGRHIWILRDDFKSGRMQESC